MKQITIKSAPVKSKVKGVIDRETVDILSNACSFEVQEAQYMARSSKSKKFKHWDGKKRLYHRGHHTFYTGLMDRVYDVLRSHGYGVEIMCPKIYDTPVRKKLDVSPDYKLHPYQDDVLKKSVAEGRGMIQVATGGGKTVIAAHLLSHYASPAIFLVHTKDLLYQAKESFSKILGEELIGQIGDGVVDPRMITVSTIQTMVRAFGKEYETDEYSEEQEGWLDPFTDHKNPAIRKMANEARVVMMDECHRVASRTATTVMESISEAPHRFGLSASPWRDDGQDLILEAMFGPILRRVPATQLIDTGYLVRPLIRMLEVPPMTFPKGTHYETIYRDYVVENSERNRLGIDAALQMIRQGRPTLLLVSRINHGHEVAERLSMALGMSIPFISGNDRSGVRQVVIQGLRDGHIPAFVATTIADEGLDIKPVSGMVLLGGGKSSTRALQRVGRSLRTFKGKEDSIIVDFVDNAKYLLDHSRKRQEIYETEPGFMITDV